MLDDDTLMAYNAFPGGMSSMHASPFSFGGPDPSDMTELHAQALPAPSFAQQQQQPQQQQYYQQPSQPSQPSQPQQPQVQQVQQAHQQVQHAQASQQQQLYQQQQQQTQQRLFFSAQQQQQAAAQASAAQAQAQAAAQAAAQAQAAADHYYEPGYLEVLWARRRDVAKLFILAVVVLLALSMHSAAWHYLKEYIDTSAQLTYWQEVGVRAAYPVAVLLVLWHCKSFL